MPLPGALRRSLTGDRGKRLAQHATLRIDTDVPIYFTDPHSPWLVGHQGEMFGSVASDSTCWRLLDASTTAP